MTAEITVPILATPSARLPVFVVAPGDGAAVESQQSWGATGCGSLDMVMSSEKRCLLSYRWNVHSTTRPNRFRRIAGQIPVTLLRYTQQRIQ